MLLAKSDMSFFMPSGSSMRWTGLRGQYFIELIFLSRPDRDSHITINIKSQYSFSPEDLKLWNLGDSNHNKSELSTLTTNFDLNSVMQYSSYFGFRTFNDFYNQVGFGNTFDLTATDKVALNILYSCQDIKMKVFQEFLNEETMRTYIELLNLNIIPNGKSQRCNSIRL